MSRKLVDEALEEAKALGIRNILALRGDPPRPEEYRIDGEEDSNRDFSYAVDLVRYIRQQHGEYFCVGVAGYPEGHADESHPAYQSVEHDLPYLVEKVSAGAEFIINVRGRFVLTGGGQGSQLRVAGGVLPSDVLYNIIGAGSDVAFSGGGGGVGCCKAIVDGTLLAPRRKIRLSPGLVNGQVISGKDINITSGASVRCPRP